MKIHIRNATITIKDGGVTSAQQSITVKVGEGNLTYAVRQEREYILDRGDLDDVRDGDQVPCEVSFEFSWEYIEGGSASGATPTVEDALRKINAAAAWVSTDADACRPYAVDIDVLYDPNCSGGDKERLVFSDFRYEEINHDLRAGTISVSGKCNAVAPATSRGSTV